MNRIGRIFANVYEAGEVVGVDVSRFNHANTRADIAGDPHGKRDASIRVFEDGRSGCVCNFKTDEYAYWTEDYSDSWSHEEKQKRLKEIEVKKIERDRMEAIELREGMFTASAILRACKPVTTHPYLTKKRIKPTRTMFEIDARVLDSFFEERGIRNGSGRFFRTGFRGRVLVTPMYKGSELRTLQFIDANGNKQYMKGGKHPSACWLSRPIEDYQNSDVIGIAEGVATARSVEMVEGFPCVAVTTCHNFLAVARYLRGLFRHKRIVILSDVGEGEKQAQEAKDAIGAELYKPPFNDELIRRFKAITGTDKNPSDWNDFYIAEGSLINDE